MNRQSKYRIRYNNNGVIETQYAYGRQELNFVLTTISQPILTIHRIFKDGSVKEIIKC